MTKEKTKTNSESDIARQSTLWKNLITNPKVPKPISGHSGRTCAKSRKTPRENCETAKKRENRKNARAPCPIWIKSLFSHWAEKAPAYSSPRTNPRDKRRRIHRKADSLEWNGRIFTSVAQKFSTTPSLAQCEDQLGALRNYNIAQCHILCEKNGRQSGDNSAVERLWHDNSVHVAPLVSGSCHGSVVAIREWRFFREG